MRRHFPSRRRFSGPLAGLTALAAVASAALTVAAPASATGAEPDRRVLVQLTGRPAGAGQRTAVRAEQTTFRARAKAAGVRLTGTHTFDRLVNAVAARVPADQVDDLRAMSGVRAVYDDVRVQAVDDESLDVIGAPQVWRRDDPQGRPAKGAGQVVAVIDSGVDYTNPDLGGGFGPGHKVVGGVDLVNGDADPMDDNGHGTHIAGIVAGKSAADGGVTGVAPDAEVMAYKALDRSGGAYASTVIEALELATDPANPHRADVVNMSLGGAGDGTDLMGQAATAAVRAGAVVVAAAGNSGPGAQTILSPAAADGVIAVGASSTGVRTPTLHLVRPRAEVLQTYRVPFSANPPAKPVEASVVDVGAGKPADYDKAGDVEGKVVLFRGPLAANPADVRAAQIELAREAERHGAIAGIGWDPAANTVAAAQDTAHTTESGDDLRMDRLVVLGMDKTQYGLLAADLAAGAVRVRLSGTDTTDQIGTFSSRGPSDRFGLKPDLVAPGVEIRSTVPAKQYGSPTRRMSGTSMSAPHVAGAAALLRQLRPDRTAAQVGGALVGTAHPLADQAPTTQGAGRLDVAAAAGASVTASPASLSLGLLDLAGRRVSATGSVRLTNPTNRAVTASLRTSEAKDSAGQSTVTPRSVTVPAGGTAKVTVRVSAARPSADAELSGWVVADLSGSAPTLRVPYLAVARPLLVQTSPDPGDGTSEAFVYSAVPLSAPPVLTVHPPNGRPTQVTARLDHGTWYRASVGGAAAGTYRVEASGKASSGTRLYGTGTFEAVPVDVRDTAWQPVGPNGQAQYLATSDDDPKLGVATVLSDPGLWLTRDRGATWRRLGRLPVAGGEGRVVVDPRDADTMWYALNGRAGTAVLDPAYEGKLLRSKDGGKTWTTLPYPNAVTLGFHLAGDGRTLVGVTASAVNVSHDGGETWTTHPIGDGGYIYASAMSGADLYLVRNNALQRVRDVTGEPGAVETLPDAGKASQLAADDRDVVTVSSDRVVRRSSDGGATWQQTFTLPSGSVVGAYAVDGEFYVATTQGRWWSKDRGATWQQYGKPFEGAVEQDYSKWPGDHETVVASAANAGIFTTTDRQHYRRIGVPARTVNDLAIGRKPDGTWTLNAATIASMYRTDLPTGPVTASTAEWGFSGGEARTGAEVRTVAAAPSDPRVMWRARPSVFGDFGIERSADGGETWTAKGRTSESPRRMAVSPHDPDTVAVPYGGVKGTGVYTTTDGGTTWRRMHYDSVPTALAFDPVHPRRLWVGTASGLYVSDDGGASVRRVATGAVNAIALDARTPNRVVIGGSTIRVSTDGGRTFTEARSGDLAMRVSDVVVSPTSSRTLYAGTSSFAANGLRKGGRGVLRSTDGGRTWQNVSAGLQQLDVTVLQPTADGRYLFAATNYGGVHRLSLR